MSQTTDPSCVGRHLQDLTSSAIDNSAKTITTQAETSDGAAGVAGGRTLIIHVGLPDNWTDEWGPSDDATVGDFVKTTKRFYSDLLAPDTMLAWGKKPLDASDERTLVEAGFTGGEEIQLLRASDDIDIQTTEETCLLDVAPFEGSTMVSQSVRLVRGPG